MTHEEKFEAFMNAIIGAEIVASIQDDMITQIYNATTARNSAAEAREMNEAMYRAQKAKRHGENYGMKFNVPTENRDDQPIPGDPKKPIIDVESTVTRLTSEPSSAIVISNTLKQ